MTENQWVLYSLNFTFQWRLQFTNVATKHTVHWHVQVHQTFNLAHLFTISHNHHHTVYKGISHIHTPRNNAASLIILWFLFILINMLRIYLFSHFIKTSTLQLHMVPNRFLMSRMFMFLLLLLDILRQLWKNNQTNKKTKNTKQLSNEAWTQMKSETKSFVEIICRILEPSNKP